MKYLCFDIGGTFIKYGILNSKGNILLKDKIPTPKQNCRESIPTTLIETVIKYNQNHDLTAIGISSAGQVDNTTGSVIYAAPTIPDYKGCELSELISNATGLPVFVENDANCAALGEIWIGAGKDFENFICLTLGTGVGGAIILHRKLFSGYHNAAGDFGRIFISSKIIKQNNSGKKHFDYTGSTKSLLDRYKILTGKTIDGFDIVERIKASEKKAIEAYRDFLDSLINGLQTVTYIIDPEAIIIGGGISSQGKFFLDKVKDLFHKSLVGIQKTKIIKADLENDAGLIGAAYICQNRNYLI
jgi:glucokinase